MTSLSLFPFSPFECGEDLRGLLGFTCGGNRRRKGKETEFCRDIQNVPVQSVSEHRPVEKGFPSNY